MLARRLLSSPSPSTLVRTLSTTTPLHRAPSLADITHDNAGLFDKRQQEFRDSQKAAAKAKKEADSQSKPLPNTPSSSSTHSGSPDAGPTSDAAVLGKVADKLSLGSLSTATGSEREAQNESESTKRKGALAQLIYGTKEGREMDQDIEKSFSQVLARGKYVHSIVFHQVKPDKVDEYVELVGQWYPKVAGLEDNHVNLVGSWRTEVGECDTFGESSFLFNATISPHPFYLHQANC